MAYEVVKNVRGRGYRYRVESVRNPETGRSKATWTYLGRLVDAAEPQPVPGPTTRERLLCALERLLETQSFADVTATAIASEAGLAHGTFYRHFKDKTEALMAAVGAVGERVERYAVAPEAAVADAATERERVRTWVQRKLDASFAVPGLVRTWFALAAQDPMLSARSMQRRAEYLERFTAYVERLRAAGLCNAPDAAVVAYGMMAIMDGTIRIWLEAAPEVQASHKRHAVAAIERLFFGDV